MGYDSSMGAGGFGDSQGKAKGRTINDFFGQPKNSEVVNSTDSVPSLGNLQQVKASYPVHFKASSSLLRLIVVIAEQPMERGEKKILVSNIVLQDRSGTEVRMALWKDNTRHQSVFSANLGKEVLLGNVTLRSVSGDVLNFIPDSSFRSELSVTGDLYLKSVNSEIPKVNRLRDLIGNYGLMQGILQLRVGKGAVVRRFRGTDYKLIELHDGKNRIAVYFAHAIDTSKMRKSSEVVIKKLRLVRKPGDLESDSRACLVESSRDFNMVTVKTIRDVELKTLPEIFSMGGNMEK